MIQVRLLVCGSHQIDFLCRMFPQSRKNFCEKEWDKASAAIRLSLLSLRSAATSP
jgi:hypothetical protein